MNQIRENYEISFKSEYGHLAYKMICPSCNEESICLHESYPATVICPFCKTTFEISMYDGYTKIEANYAYH